jgi:hypothetical protein
VPPTPDSALNVRHRNSLGQRAASLDLAREEDWYSAESPRETPAPSEKLHRPGPDKAVRFGRSLHASIGLGLVMPLADVDGDTPTAQYRPDKPLADGKYLSRPGCRPTLYVPGRVRRDRGGVPLPGRRRPVRRLGR